MKKDFIVLTFVFGLIFFIATALYADEMRELKDQVNALQSTIETLKTKIEKLEQKQALQAEEVAKIPKITKLAKTVEELKTNAAKGLFGEGARLGGHFKLYLFDQTKGERNTNKQHNNSSAGISSAFIYIDKDLSDTTSISIQPNIDVTASATPSLGSNITRDTSSSTSTNLHQAFIKTALPRGIELKAGLFLPLFSEEYGTEVWWDEQYHQNKGLVDLESLSGTGVEFYKNFDLKRFSLPIWFYLLNGNENYTSSTDNGKMVDNNKGKSVLIHIAPQISNLKFMGSLGRGKWDNSNNSDAWCYATGFEWIYKKFTLRSEYLFRKYEDKSLTLGGLTDTEKKGYYLKGLYRFNPKWRGLINYSEVSLPYTGGSSLLKDKYKATTLGLNYFITDSSIIMGELSFVDGRRSDASEKLRYYRSTIGWCTTF